jgi:hypothetical protein
MEYDPKKSAEEVNDDTVEEDDTEIDSGERDERKYDLEDPTIGNLVTVFKKSNKGKEALRKIQERIITDYESARDAVSERVEKIAEDWKYFSNQIPRTSDYPYQGAPNPHIPIVMVQSLRMYSKIHSELFRDWNNLFGVRPMSENDKVTAQILTTHGNWQLRSQLPDFRRQMERMTLRFVVVGDVNIHSWYDTVTDLNRHEVLSEDMCYIPYVSTSVMPDYSDVPFIVKVLKLQTSDLEQRVDTWEGVKNILKGDPADWSDEESFEHTLHEQQREGQGIELPEKSADAPHTLLWYEGWMLLPGQDRQRFCQAIVHHSSGTILTLKLHEEEDWRDRKRWEAQMDEYQAYKAQVEAYDAFYAQPPPEGPAPFAQPPPEPPLGLGGMGGRFPPTPFAPGPQQQMIAPPEPQPPSWATPIEGDAQLLPDIEEPEPIKMVPIRLFTHIVCVEPYAGSIGFSMIGIAGAFNKLANTAAAQFIDAASFANVKSFLTGENNRCPSELRIKPGGVTKLKGIPSAKVREAMFPLEFGPANPQLMELVDRAQRWSEQAASTPGAIAGEPGKSGEPYRGYAARIEQANQMLSIPSDKLRSGFVNVLKNNAKLNAKFLPDEEIISVTDGIAVPQMIRVSRKMYERNYDVELTTDSKFTTNAQRIAEADENVQTMVQMFQLFQNHPQIGAVLQQAIAESFEARGRRVLATKVRQLQLVPQGPLQSPGGGQPGNAPGGPRPPGAPGARGVARGGPQPGMSRAPAPPPGMAAERGAPR